jgi:hypothetical protein
MTLKVPVKSADRQPRVEGAVVEVLPLVGKVVVALPPPPAEVGELVPGAVVLALAVVGVVVGVVVGADWWPLLPQPARAAMPTASAARVTRRGARSVMTGVLLTG